MANQKPGLSRDEHTELGAELAQMRDRLGAIAVQLDHAYPHTVSDLAIRAQQDLDTLRSKLDELLFREHPGLSTKENAGAYYPERGQGSQG